MNLSLAVSSDSNKEGVEDHLHKKMIKRLLTLNHEYQHFIMFQKQICITFYKHIYHRNPQLSLNYPVCKSNSIVQANHFNYIL